MDEVPTVVGVAVRRRGRIIQRVRSLQGRRGAEPQLTLFTPATPPSGIRCWWLPFAFITNRSLQQKSSYRRSSEKAI